MSPIFIAMGSLLAGTYFWIAGAPPVPAPPALPPLPPVPDPTAIPTNPPPVPYMAGSPGDAIAAPPADRVAHGQLLPPLTPLRWVAVGLGVVGVGALVVGVVGRAR